MAKSRLAKEKSPQENPKNVLWLGLRVGNQTFEDELDVGVSDLTAIYGTTNAEVVRPRCINKRSPEEDD